MRKGLKPALALALLCMLAVFVSACGGGEDSTGESTSATSGSTDISGTLTIWDFEYELLPEYTEAIDQLDAEFEKLNPGVKIDRVAQPVEGYEALVTAAFTGREGPDVMYMQPGTAGVLSFTKGLEVLNDRISPELEEQLNQWPSTTAGYGVEGDHYGVPIGVQGEVFYYNKKLFKQAGLPTDFQPETWDEVLEAGEKLKAAGIQPFTGGNSEGFENLFWFAASWGTVNTVEEGLELAEGEVPYTDETVAKAFGPMIEVEDAGLYPDDRFSTSLWTEGFPRFAEGKGAMTLGFWNSIGYWGEFNPKLGEKNVGMFAPPGVDSPKVNSSFAVSIPTYTDNKDAAWAWIEFLTSKKSIEKLYDVGGFLPNRNDVSLPSDAPTQAQELVAVSQEPGTTLPVTLMLPLSVTNAMLTEISEVLQGRMSLEDAQKAIQEAAENTAE